MIRGLIITALLLPTLLLFFPKEAYAQNRVSLYIEDPVIKLDLKRGEDKIVNIPIRNTGDTDGKLHVDLYDIESINYKGQIILDATSTEISSWVSIDDSLLNVDEGQAKDVSLFIDIPTDITPGAYSLLANISMTALSDDNQVKIQATTSAGASVAILMNVEGDVSLTEEGEVQDWTLEGGIFGPHLFSFNYANVGEAIILPVGSIQISDQFDNIKDVNVLEDHWVIPSSYREYSFSWQPQNTFGRYKARLEIINKDGTTEIVRENYWSFRGWGQKALFVFVVTGIFIGAWLIKLLYKLIF